MVQESTAMAHVKLLQQVNAQVSMAEADAAWHAKRDYAARLIRTTKEEKVDLSDDQDGNDARRKLGRLLDEVCIRKRIHHSLGYLTPAGLEDQLQREQAVMHDVFQETAMQVSNLRGTLLLPVQSCPGFRLIEEPR
jgi:hypothetical protein